MAIGGGLIAVSDEEVPVVTEEDLPEDLDSEDPCILFFSHTEEGELSKVRLVEGVESSVQVKMARAEMKMTSHVTGEVEGWACHVAQLYLELTGGDEIEFEDFQAEGLD